MGRREVFFHPQGEAAVAQLCFDTLPWSGIAMAAQRFALGVKQDAVAAAERGQWADHVEGLGQTFHSLTALLQGLGDCTGQASIQLVEALA